ncbi:MAG: DUF1501 domain-containing protein, partial [Planctomycetales bacterium]|nr:DUF1501 domain-containing protein [Planctomycetales bacterium]
MPLPEMTNENRRDFMRSVASRCLGVSFGGAVGSGAMLSLGEAQAANVPSGKAKHIIYLFMEGAMTHLDTFDPKTGVPEAGET